MAITGSPPNINTWTVPPPPGRELFQDKWGIYYMSNPPGGVDASGNLLKGNKIYHPATLPADATAFLAQGAAQASATAAQMAPAGQTNLGDDKQMATEVSIEEIGRMLMENPPKITLDQARELIRAALIRASGGNEIGVDQRGEAILNSYIQRNPYFQNMNGDADGGGAAADGALWRDPIISEPSFGQAFSRFLGGTPFAATPGLMSAAAAMRPIAQTQFQLQPSTPVWDLETGELQPRDIGEFSQFLKGAFGGAGGSFLRGGDLSKRLAELTMALYRERGQGGNPLNPDLPQDTRQAQLFQEFGDPQNTFSAFNLPGLMATRGRGRALLAAAQQRFQNRWLGQNPSATGFDVAKQVFGSTPWLIPGLEATR